MANIVRERKNGNNAFYIVNLHINYSNVCKNECKFCAFSRREMTEDGAYEMSIDEIMERAAQVEPSGATEIHIVGGAHPSWPFSRYMEMMGRIKEAHPSVHLQAFTAVEIAHIAAHEIGHQYIADRIGSGHWRALPHWKQEGLPEYIAEIRADPSLDLVSRIEVLEDDSRWTSTPAGRRRGWARVHYEAGLLVEFLLDVQGLSLEQIVSDRVTKSDTHSAMMSWTSPQRI